MNAITPLPSHVSLPPFIAICGNPKSGKSLVQQFLRKHFSYQPVDDGEVIRRFAIDHLGLSWDDAYTQAGKAGYVDILGKRWQVRDILGTYGNKLEEMFGPHAMPYLATKKLGVGLFSFGSVRRDQGKFYQARGGKVLMVARAEAGPSPYEFDSFDISIVDLRIINDGTFEDLEAGVIAAVNQLVEIAL